MTTQEVANRLIELCRQGQAAQAQKELYADNAVSIEPEGSNWSPRTEGKAEIAAKMAQWNGMVEEIHSAEISDPICAGNYFSCTMKYDVSFKGMGRSQMEEVAVYQVNDGQVVSEQFFYPAAPKA